MIAKFDFDINYDVVINHHMVCVEEPAKNLQVWYTGGSKMAKDVKVGVNGPHFRLSKYLGYIPTLSQVEVHSI